MMKLKNYKIEEHCMVAYAAQSPTLEANAGQHSVHAHVNSNYIQSYSYSHGLESGQT
ncbi:MAG: hypothetical protein IPN76_15470 [Saprospiraceae bacterium]|nr:hypothetical protein [Saprospiraceae bacterium]